MTRKVYAILVVTFLALLGLGLHSHQHSKQLCRNNRKSITVRDLRTITEPSSSLETASLCPEVKGSDRTTTKEAKTTEVTPAAVDQTVSDATRFKGETDEVSVIVRAEQGVFPAGTEMRVAPVSAKTTMAAVQKQCGDEQEVVDAVATDITFWLDGREIQPDGDVIVSMYAKRNVEGETHEAVTVRHDGIAEVMGDACGNMGAFTTDHFTVYAIVGKTYGGRNMTKYARQVYNFYLDGILIQTQIVKDGDALSAPPAPGGYSKKEFIGWFKENTDTEFPFGTVSIPSTQTTNDTFRIDARFKNLYKVTFYANEAKTDVLKTAIVENESAVTLINETEAVANGLHVEDGKALVAWKDADDTVRIDGSDGNDGKVTVNGADIDLMPVYAKAHRVSFDLVLEEVFTETIPVQTVANGRKIENTSGYTEGTVYKFYEFGGWYTDDNFDPDAATLDEKYTGSPVDLSTWELNETDDDFIVLHAKWIPDVVRFAVTPFREAQNASSYEEIISDSKVFEWEPGTNFPINNIMSYFHNDYYKNSDQSGIGKCHWSGKPDITGNSTLDSVGPNAILEKGVFLPAVQVMDKEGNVIATYDYNGTLNGAVDRDQIGSVRVNYNRDRYHLHIRFVGPISDDGLTLNEYGLGLADEYELDRLHLDTIEFPEDIIVKHSQHLYKVTHLVYDYGHIYDPLMKVPFYYNRRNSNISDFKQGGQTVFDETQQSWPIKPKEHFNDGDVVFIQCEVNYNQKDYTWISLFYDNVSSWNEIQANGVAPASQTSTTTGYKSDGTQSGYKIGHGHNFDLGKKEGSAYRIVAVTGHQAYKFSGSGEQFHYITGTDTIVWDSVELKSITLWSRNGYWNGDLNTGTPGDADPIYFHCVPNTFNVTFKQTKDGTVNGFDVLESSKEDDLTITGIYYGTPISDITAQAPDWSTLTDVRGVVYTPDGDWKCLQYPEGIPDGIMPAEDLIFYREWITDQYTVTFDYDYDIGGGIRTEDIENVSYGNAVPTPTEAYLTREGYTLTGWRFYERLTDEESNVSKGLELPGVSFNSVVTQDLYIVAHWALNKGFNVEYRNGAHGKFMQGETELTTITNPLVYRGSSAPVNYIPVADEDYVFVGYKIIDKNGILHDLEDQKSIDYEADYDLAAEGAQHGLIALVAQYEPLSSSTSLTYHSNYPSKQNEEDVTIDNLVVNGDYITRDITDMTGWVASYINNDTTYTFKAWISTPEEAVFTNSSSLEYFYPGDTIAVGKENNNLYAVWEATFNISGSKTWSDAENQDGKRPNSITINLLADEVEVNDATVTPDESGNWKWTFTDLPKYANGTEIVYTITEDAVENYTTEVNDYNVTNSHTPETVSINAAKVWIDSDSRSRKQVPVTFYQTTDATAAFDPANVGTVWTTLKDTFFTVADTNTVSLTVAKYNSGKLLRYAFAETVPTGYHASPTYKLFATTADATALHDTVRNIANTAAVATLMPVLKKISGRNWLESDSFLIVLHDPNNTNPMPANSINDGSYIYAPLLAINDSTSIADTARLLRFGPITFNIGDLEGKSDSTFTYNLLESTSQQSGLPRPVGITYDSKMYKVSITVRAEGATPGTMDASVVCTPINDNTPLDTVSFVNIYDHESTTYYISGAKELHTRGVTKSLQDGDYTFTLKPAGSGIEKAKTPMPADCQGTGANRISTTQNMGSNVKFNDIVFNHAQLLADGFTDGDLIQGVTFKYEVAEQIPADAQNLGTGVWLRKEVNADGDTLEYYYDATIHYRVITVTLEERPGEVAVLNVTGHVSNEMNEYWPTANGPHMLTQEEHARRHYNGAPQFHNVIIARTKVPVEKVWDDYDNFFGLRPSNVHVSLLANDITTGKELILSNVNQWADTFKNLPSAILDPSTFTLTDINYTVSEPTATPVAANNNNLVEAVNYTPVTTGNATTGFTITNSIKNVEIDTTIAVRKVWAGGTPAGSSVTIQLYRNDSPLDSWTYLDDNDQSVTGSGTLTLSGDTWTGTFPHLPKFDENYVAYTYSIAETQIQTTDSKFYLAKITGNSANGYTVTNTPSPGLTKLVNGSNATMRLNDWSTPIPYSISTYIPVTDHLNGFVITDTLESVLDTASQPVIKINNVTIDNNNVYTYNPATRLLTFDLGDYLTDAYQGKSVQITFNAKIRSTVTYADLEPYLNTETNEPDVPNHARYTLTVDNKDTFRLSDTVFVTPTYIELLAEKIWVDQNDNDRHRPANITVNLYADYEDGAIATFTLDKNNPLNTTNIWRLNMGKWPKMYNGNDIEYSIQEVGNLTAYYTSSASVITPTSDPRKFDIVLTNTHEPDSIEIKAIKIWKDNGNASGKRMPTVVQLYRSSGMSNAMFVPASIPAEGNANWFPYGPTREISTSDKDTLVWKVPKFDNGVAYRYAVREFDVPEGYRTTYTSSGIMNNNQVTITNEYLPPVNVTLTAQKKIRGRNWFTDDHFTFALKPRQQNNPMPANSIDHNGVLQSRTQVTYDSTYISDSVRAVTFAPITFRLEDMGNSRTKTFHYVIQELTPDEAGEARVMGITYSTIPYYADIIVQKGANDSLIASVNYYYLTQNDNQTQDEDQTISQNVDTPMVVNTYNPSSFLFRPIANKSFIYASTNAISLSDSMFSFKLSPVGANASNAPMPSGTQGTLDERYYIAGNTGNSIYFFKGGEDGLLFDHIALREHFTDSQLAEGVTFEYRMEEIIPEDADTLDNGIMRLTSSNYISYYDAFVHFIQLDVKLDENDSLTFINNPNPTLRDFYVKPGGDTVFVERGTEFSLLHHNDGIAVFRNSRIGLTSLRVSKNWVDYNNSLQLRPEQIIVKLLADDDSVNVASLNGTNNWGYTFTKLPFANITDAYEIDTIHYSVEEVPIPNYLSFYNFASNGVDVINTLDSNIVKRDTNITVRKNWIGPDDTEYPDITFYLLRDNVKIDSVILHEGTLTHTFTNLPYYDVYENGKVIVDNSTLRKFNYMIDERPVNGFSTQINNAEGEITNTILQDYTSVSGEKSWIDPAGTFHPTVTIVLERDGDSVNFVRLENGITHYAFNNLPVYDLTVNGEPIVEGDGHRFEYSVRELPVNGYSSEKDGNDFVNTINQAYIDIPVSKIWNDRSNQDGYRPESVTLKLTGTTNLPYSQEYTLDITGEGNTWNSVFRNLPKYDQARNVITYTLSEPNTPQHYTQSVNGYSITNTHRPDSVLVHVSKIWNDHLNNDAYRPVSITLHLMVGNDTLQSRTVAGTGHEWEVSFGKWPRRSNGMDIAYTVKEDAIAHYTVSNAIHVQTSDVTRYNLQITNTHVLDSIRPIVNKSWEVPTGLETSDIAPAQLTLYRTSQLNVPFDPHSENWTQIGTIAVPFSSTTVQIDFGKQPKFDRTSQYRYYVHESNLDVSFEATYGNNGELNPIGNTDTITENINNRYIMPATIVLPLKKILLGRAWQETDTFEMALIPQGDAPMPVDDIDVEGIPYGSLIITADSLNHGGHDSLRIGTFPPVIFKLEDMGGTNEKVFLYHIRELNSGESGLPRLPGVSYSSELYHVDITVRKVGLSLQIHSISITEAHSHTDADTAVITNHFNNIQTDFILKAEKELTTKGIHQTLSDGDYHFVLRPVGENAANAPMPNGTEGVGANRHFSVPNEGHLVEFEGTDNKGILFEYDDLLTLFGENALLEGVTFYYEISEEIPTDAILNDDGSYTRSRTVLNEEGIMVDETYDAVSHVRPVTVRKITVDGQDILEVTAGNCASHYYEDDNTIDIGTHRHGTGGVPIFHNLLKAKVSVTVEKRWDDWHNALETRPSSVSVTLLANGVETDSVAVLNADNNWRYDFHNLTVTDANGVINYTVREDSVSHYEATYSGDMEEGLIILNTLTTYGGDDDCGILVDRDQLNECSEAPCPATVTDADGYTYAVVKIDGYCWMAENLRTQTPNAMSYQSAVSPDAAQNMATYGYLYTWFDAAGGTDNPEPIDGYVRGVCPNGWHLPTAKEINVLMTNSSDALRSESYWAIPAEGANSTGFNALPAGYYNAAAQRFEGLHSTTLFHGDTPSSLFSLEYYCCKILPDQQTLQNGYSVRCVKDCE